jgi:hypothetical protein
MSQSSSLEDKATDAAKLSMQWCTIQIYTDITSATEKQWKRKKKKKKINSTSVTI